SPDLAMTLTSQTEMGAILVPWQRPPQQRYVLSGANIVDVRRGVIIRSATIHLHGGVVTSVNGSKEEWEHDPHTVKLELAGKYVCPGLVDCHVHLAAVPGEKDLRGMKTLHPNTTILRQPQVCKAMLERGFTTVRDCGGADAALRQAIEQGVHP